jgi:hypothetical protein
MTKSELEAFQNAIDRIGSGLDALMDLACALEEKDKRKPAQRINPPKKKVAKT